MSKKIIYIIFLLIGIHFVHSQIDGNILVGLTNVTTTEMNAITNAPAGALAFNSTESQVYQYNGTSWTKIQNVTSVIVEEKIADYTLTANDNGKVFTFNNSIDLILTVPSGLPIGFNISVYQIGDGKVTFTEDTGVTVKNRQLKLQTAGKDAGAGLIATALNIFHLTGDLRK